jgi:hypothetical protein
MKKTSLLVASALLASSALFAQDSVTSNVVGYTTNTISSGYNAIGTTFEKASMFNGAIVSATTDTLTLSGSPTLPSGSSYYLEVTSSSADLEGERVDVASVDGAVVTLNVGSSNNTISDVSSFPADSTVVIRPHFTIGDFNALLGGSVNSDDTFVANKSDQILTFENGAFRAHIEYAGVWYKNYGDFAAVTDKVIAPGSGFFYFRNPSAGSATDIIYTTTGDVRENDFALKLNTGYQFVSTGYPVASTPLEMQLNGNLQNSANFVVSESDLIVTWDKSSQAFRTHLQYADNFYQNFGSFGVIDNDDVFGAGDAALVLVRSTAQVLGLPRPY